jgi:hypothetical protein
VIRLKDAHKGASAAVILGGPSLIASGCCSTFSGSVPTTWASRAITSTCRCRCTTTSVADGSDAEASDSVSDAALTQELFRAPITYR